MLRLHANEHPEAAPEDVVRAVWAATRALHRYPPAPAAVATSVAERHGMPADHVLVGAGSAELITLAWRAFTGATRAALFQVPAFELYPLLSLQCSTPVVTVPVPPPGGAAAALAELVVGRDVGLVALSNPHNPTGEFVPRRVIADVARRLPESTVVLNDEAYHEYADPTPDDLTLAEISQLPNVITTRTFSKIYGLAGLRVGWAVAPADVATATSKVRRAFDVSATAQAAALASLDDPQEIARRRELNATGRDRLAEILHGHGLDPAGPAHGNFLFADVGGGRELFERLLREGVIVRPLDGFGAPEGIRVTVGAPDENEAFAVALGHVLSGVS
jgi:histidinol-phosphate aminotransferase